jgi:hypothetical protein
MILFKDDIGRGRLALLLLALLLSVFVLSPAAYSRADNLYELEITGDGVSNPMTFTMDQLQDLEVYQQVYSTINTWPTKRFYIARGVRLKQLLDLAGIQDEAKVIKFYSYDGYEVSLTVKELLKDKRYYYPHLMENGGSDGSVAGSSADKEEVDAILAWESAESSTDPEEMNDMNALLLIFGQRAVTEQTNTLFLKHVNKVEVLKADPGKWDKPRASINSTEVAPGSLLELSSKGNDIDKVYYTTDGSTPTIESPIFNWSAKRWWTQRPDSLGSINKPIVINQDMVIKAIVIGPGKEDSEVMTFSYKVGLQDSPGQDLPAAVPTTISLDRDQLELKVGGSFELYATVGPDDVIDKSIIWTSSDTRVATVDKHGLVTMVGEGTAVITARTQAGGLEASCTVSSQSPVAQAQLTPDSEDDPSLAGEKDTPHSSREEQEELSPQENTSSGLGEKPPLASSSEPESNSDRYRYLIKRELADPTLAEQDSSYQGADSQAEMEISADYLPLAMEQRRLKSHIIPIFIILFLSGALREYWQYKKEAIS